MQKKAAKKTVKRAAPRTKTSHRTTHRAANAQPELGALLREAAQQIWLAGMSAMLTSRDEGGRVATALMRESSSWQRRTGRATREGFRDAAQNLGRAANSATSRLGEGLEQLESRFESQLAGGLRRLGMPSPAEWRSLMRRVEVLESRRTSSGSTRKGRAKGGHSSPKNQ